MAPLLALLLAAQIPRDGVLDLPAGDPVIAVTVAGQTLRLRVDLDQRDAVLLNPAAAERLPLQWQGGDVADLGGEQLDGRRATGEARIAGHRAILSFEQFGRDCCAGVDGAVSPVLLPYATVRWRRAGAAGGTVRHYPVRADGGDGLTVAQGPVAVQLSLSQPDTLASRAAGVLLADRHGGRYAGPFMQIPGPFGVPRAVRPVAFATPPVLLGFELPVIAMRTGDFGGGLDMPEDRTAPGDIVVRRGTRAQRRWPIVTLGRDQLEQCSEIAFHADTLTLDLDCPVAGAGAGP